MADNVREPWQIATDQLDKSIGDLRNQLAASNKEIADLRGDLRQDISGLRDDLKDYAKQLSQQAVSQSGDSKALKVVTGIVMLCWRAQLAAVSGQAAPRLRCQNA